MASRDYSEVQRALHEIVSSGKKSYTPDPKPAPKKKGKRGK